MLIRFQTSNFRSVSEPVELSMVAIDRNRPEARAQPALGESLLPLAAIYGPNASGKTNVLGALVWLVDAVESSLRTWEDNIPVDPFAFASPAARTTEFELELILNGVRFEYDLEVAADGIQYEALFEYPQRRRRRVFEREGQTLTLQRGLGGLTGITRLWTPMTLMLSYGSTFQGATVSQFARAVDAIQYMGRFPVPDSRFGRPGHSVWRGRATATTDLFDYKQPTLFDEADNDRYARIRALQMLRMADPYIEDVRFVEMTNSPTAGKTRRPKTMQLVHSVTGEQQPLDFANESAGTQAWFTLVGPALAALRTGSPLIVDELDASLHPKLSAKLLTLFANPQTNPRGAQLIVTTHDTSLLAYLNRDEVWFTEKQTDGSTRLGPLTDFASDRVRRSVNLEAGYLAGRFGALPDLDDHALLRALDLIG